MWKKVNLKSITEKTLQWKPAKEPRDFFYYIDVSSVSNETFSIKKPQKINATSAPGRARKIVKWQDTIYATIRPSLKRIAYISNEYDDQIASTAFCVIRPDRNIAFPLYIYYSLLSDSINSKIIELQHGASYPAVTDKDILNQSVPLPPLKEQQKIAAVLLKIQQAIEVQESIIEAAQDLKKSTMQHVFTYGLREENTKETKIGRMPESWLINLLGNLVKVKGGKRLPRGKQLLEEKTRYPYIRVCDLKNNSIAMDQLMYVPVDVQPQIKKYVINSKDIYISIAGTTGLVGIIPSELDGAQLTENAARLVLLSDPPDQKYLMRFLDSSHGQSQIESMTMKTSQPKLALSRIKQIKIVLPPDREQIEIASILQSIDNKIKLHLAKKSALQDLFKTMLNKLMTGKVRVQDADIDTSCVLEMENRG